jgi:hypothetical protein
MAYSRPSRYMKFWSSGNNDHNVQVICQGIIMGREHWFKGLGLTGLSLSLNGWIRVPCAPLVSCLLVRWLVLYWVTFKIPEFDIQIVVSHLIAIHKCFPNHRFQLICQKACSSLKVGSWPAWLTNRISRVVHISKTRLPVLTSLVRKAHNTSSPSQSILEVPEFRCGHT